ncbi:hypothetical protein ANTPLA_LOCUS9579 [Anthophora plagiata]
MSNFPDANPMDFFIWATLETKVNIRKYESLDALKSPFVREWKKIPQTDLRAAYDSFFHRLDEIIRAKEDTSNN